MTLPAGVVIRSCRTTDLDATTLAQLLDLFAACWPDGDFTPDDVDHALGHVHWLASADGGRIVGHASVVARELHVDGRPLDAGYVEAVAVHPRWQRRGIATALMAAANAHIGERYALGALSTGVPGLYEASGWERWRGPSYVRTAAGPLRTEDEDDGILVLRTPATPVWLDPSMPISCEERPGDSW